MLWADPEASFSHITFDISVHSPTRRAFRDLATDITNGAVLHDVLMDFDWFSHTEFDTVRFNARDAPIDIKVTGKCTTNAEIDVDFVVLYETIQLETSNAPLNATIWAIDDSGNGGNTILLTNSDGPIDALIAMSSNSTEAIFRASVHTTNGDLNVQSGMTGRHLLLLEGSTSNAPGFLALPEQYEGTFDISSELGTTSLVFDPDKRDSHGRQRAVDMKVDETEHKAGKIYWGEEPPNMNQGSIKMSTTQEDVTITSFREFE
ncbi:hypothetical protein D9758_003002 [Tetrapyrgos nigripes]|uniref:Uncharacterized protein n=1 Tax=Tetrapyrgos nigripes TaxID=182062 RepID=A0A8H5LTQ2_9AGAR|nr:hypothetical protein D9758_003002 [Tetrapyrgos nigripes]